MKARHRRLLSTTCLSAAILAVSVPVAYANPIDPTVSSGAATFNTSGNTLNITQSTDRAVIDWRGFDIGAGETTAFHQPSSSSVTLNRVNSSSPSVINGTLTANGNIFIINQNGVLFGANAQVDVNGLVVSTADMSNANFMAGNFKFDAPGDPNATIENRGLITAKEAGLVGLVAPNVINSGVITARLGRVHLASGDRATVDLYGDGLMEVTVSDAVTSQLVENTGRINAAGGTIAMTAAAGSNMVNSLIRVSGELSAPSVGMKNGKIVIAAAGSNAVAGNVAANKGTKTGNSVVLVDGKLDVSGKNPGETGGSVTITADHIGLLNDAVIDATGAQGGGIVHVGGQYLGLGDTPTASITIMDAAAKIDASALLEGNGGEVIVYADTSTEFYGTIHANGAGDEGNGGFVETSGRIGLLAFGEVRVIAGRNGKAGTWLLDPADITITAGSNAGSTNAWINPKIFTAIASGSQVSAATIKASLDAGNAVIIQTANDGYAGNGDIFVNSAITTTGSGALTLTAYRNIEVNAGITLNAGALTLTADNAATGTGTITIAAAINKGSGATNFSGTDLIISGAGVLNSTGSLTIFGSSTNVTMGIGTGAAGSMNISDAELALLGGGTSLMFGGTSYSIGDVEINTAFDFGAKLLNVYSGGNITLAGTLTKSSGATGTYALRARGNVTNSNSAGVNANVGTINLSILSDTDSSGTGYINLTNASLLTNGGTIALTSNGQSASLSGSIGGATTISSAGGDVSLGVLNGDTDGTRNLTISAGTGTLTTTGILGGTNKLGSLTITANDLVLGADIYGAGTLTLQAASTTRAMNINYGPNDGTDFNLSSDEVARIKDGWNNIIFGRLDNTVAYNIGASNWDDAINIRTGVDSYTRGVITSSASNAISFSLVGISRLYVTDDITAGGNLSMSGTYSSTRMSSGKTLTSTNGNVSVISLFADGTTVNAANGTVTLSSVLNAGKNLTVDANAISLTGDIGSSGSSMGVVSLKANTGIALSSIYASTLALNFGGSVTQATSTAIRVNGLSLEGAGAYALNSFNNNISVVAANTSNTIRLTNTTSNLTIGTVRGIVGVTTAANSDYSVGSGFNVGTYTLTVNEAINIGAGDLRLTANNMAINADVNGTATGTLAIQQSTTGRAISIASGSDDGTKLHLTSAEVSRLNAGWSEMFIGNSGATSGASMNVGSVTFKNDTTLRTGTNSIGIMDGATVRTANNGSLTLSSGNITLYGNIIADGTIRFSNAWIGYAYNSVSTGNMKTVTSTNGNIIFSNGFVFDTAGVNLNALNGTISGYLTSNGRNLNATAKTISLSAVGSASASMNAVRLIAEESITLPNIFASSIFVQTTGANSDITIASGKTLTASGAGNAITLASARNFINDSVTPFNLTGSGRWLVYSTNPTADTLNGLGSDFVRYGCTYGGSCPTGVTIPGTGNGVIYTYRPTVTVTPTVNVTYGDAASLSGYSYATSGYLTSAAGNDASLDNRTGTLVGSTTYTQGADVNSYNINYVSGTLSSELGYQFTYVNNASGLVVGARTITASLIGTVSKTYDGTDVATLTSGNYSLANLYNSDAITISNTSGTYNDKTANTGKNVTVNGLTLSGAKAGNYVLASSSVTGAVGTVLQKALTITGYAASNKVYDGTTTATLTGTGSLSGVVGSDTVTLGGTVVSAFGDKNVGTSKTITVSGITISGADAANYSISQPTGLTATITAKDLTITGITAGNKVYDGTTAVTLGGTAAFSGLVGSDAVTLGGTAVGTFSDKNAATGKTVTVSGYSISGTDATNYNFIQPASLTANITAKDLTITGITAGNKTYDGTAAATLTGTAAFSGLVGSDTVTLGGAAVGTFSDKNVATGKTVTVSGYSISGGDATNYNFIQPASLTADITAKELTITGISAGNKTYDGTAAATLTGTSNLIGVIGSDVVTLGGTAAGAFGDKNVGTGKTVTVNGYSISGTDATNYSITQPTGLSANITAKDLTITGLSANSKVYDGTAAATLAGTAALSGLIGSDAVTLGGTAVGTFSDKNAATGKTVTVSGYSISGGDAGNYNFIQPVVVNADITKATLTATAGNQTISYGATVPTTTVTYSGFVGSDTVGNAIGTSATLASARSGAMTTDGTFANNYTLSGAAASNYNFTYVAGSLTVLPSTYVPPVTPTPPVTIPLPSSVAYISQMPQLNTSAPTISSGMSPAVVLVIKNDSGESKNTSSQSSKDSKKDAFYDQKEKNIRVEIAPDLAKQLGITEAMVRRSQQNMFT